MLDQLNYRLVGVGQTSCEVKVTNQKHNPRKNTAQKERMEI